MPEQQIGSTDQNQSSQDHAADPVDLTALFTPEEVTAKKESIEASKAEESRRAALTDDERAAEDAERAAKEAADQVPEQYGDFTIPEGMEMDTETLAEALPKFKELGLSQKKAQELVDLYATKIAPAFHKKAVDAWQKQVEGWGKEAEADPEIGGTKFKQSVADALRAVNTINPALKDIFNQYGLGNHKEFIKAFAKISTLLKEDNFTPNRESSAKETSIAKRMFPNLD